MSIHRSQILFLSVTGGIALQICAATNDCEYLKPGTLAFHLATNTAARAQKFSGKYSDMVEFHSFLSFDIDRFFMPKWSHNFWLREVQGLSATPIGYSNIFNGQGLFTMISPRHYLCATHMHPESHLAGFLDIHNELHWRHTLDRVDVGNDTSVGLLDDELPSSVGFLPVLPENYTNYLPTTSGSFVQSIGMNQDMMLFGEPMTFANGNFVNWNSHISVPFGLGTNWNVTIRGGDSSNPALLLIGNQFVLASHNYFAGGGPNYATQIRDINRAMHQLSTNHFLHTDYQLTQFSLTNWPKIH
jgi:hypothetical protein